MSHKKIFCRKIKSSLILFVSATVLLSSLLTTSTMMHDAFGREKEQAVENGDNPGSRYTYRVKTIYHAMIHCMAYYGTTQAVNNPKDKFSFDTGAGVDVSGWLHDQTYIEAVAEHHDKEVDRDGTTSCGKIMHDNLDSLMGAIGVSKEELYCDYSNEANYGILEEHDGIRCVDYIHNTTSKSKTKDYGGRTDYLFKLFWWKVFGGDVPGDTLWNFTQYEQYWLHLDTYRLACVYGSRDSQGHFGSNYDIIKDNIIYEANASTNMIEPSEYSLVGQKHNVELYHFYDGGDTTSRVSCATVAYRLSTEETMELRGLIDHTFREPKKSCLETFEKSYNDFKEWWDGHKDEYTGQGNAIADFDSFFTKYGAYVGDADKIFVRDTREEIKSKNIINFLCLGLEEMEKEWNALKEKYEAEEAPDAGTYDPTITDAPLPTISNETRATCGNSGGAGSLGWIVCPIMEWARNAAEGVYSDYVEPNLHISPQLFSADPSETISNAHAAWSTFRDFANIAFVIFLLFVIFSQITGVGIDNYGIKKSLPKLIIAAILINVSYYLCMGAIDISNIFGSAISDLFSAIPTGSPVAISGVDTLASEVASTSLSVIGIGIALFAAGTAVWASPAIVLTLLISLLGLIISIFFLFVILVAREAAVIVLVVLSPLAFACYMLPNTKKTYDKWFNALKGLLLVYPICSLLVSGGDWLSRLLLSAGYGASGVVKAFTAMLVGIIPIFFIPSVLKNSMAVLGTIGAKIAGVGKAAKTGATKKITDSTGYKNAQQRSLERKTRISAGIDSSGNAKSLNKWQRMIRGGSRNVARNRVAYNKMQNQNSALNAAMDPNYIQNQNELREDGERTQRENAIIAQINRNGEYNGNNYGDGGKNLEAIYVRFAELANMGDGLSQAELDERGALFRKLGSEKEGINMLNNAVYNHTLTATGLRAMNSHRVQNSDVSASLAKKDTTTSMALDAFAAGTFSYAQVTDVQHVGQTFATRALSDNARINDQSGAALNRFAEYIPDEQINGLISDNNFQQIITDQGNRNILQNVAANRRNAQNAQNVPNAQNANNDNSGYNFQGHHRVIRNGHVVTNHQSRTNPEDFSDDGAV